MTLSFIKFKYLWSAGLDARLNIETTAGQAWVSIHLRLGHPPAPHHVMPSRKTKDNPARQRRRAQREAERKQNAEQAVGVSNENNDNNSVEVDALKEWMNYVTLK